MKDRFDLEQQILSCWHIVDDIKDITNSIEKNKDNIEISEIRNFLNSIATIYEFKFTKLFELYEDVLRDMK